MGDENPPLEQLELPLHDSGNRVTFASGMVRDVDVNKIHYDLVYDGPMLKRWARQLTLGAAKYALRNWMKAHTEDELTRFRESAARHFAQWMAGETDEDHAAAVFFNVNGAEYVKSQMNPFRFISKDLPACSFQPNFTPFISGGFITNTGAKE